MSKDKVFFTCPMRTLEGQRLFDYLKNMNDNFTVVGSCVVTRQVETQTIDALKQIKGNVFVFGCISKDVEEVIRNNENATILKTTQLHKMFEFGSENLKNIENTNVCFEIEGSSLCNRHYEDVLRKSQGFFQKISRTKKTIPFLVVAHGCNNACSYCHTKFYVGKVKSKPIETIKNEYSMLLKQKHNFVNIIAEDIGSFGTDINLSLPDLLSELEKITPNKKTQWMLDGLQPKWLIQFHKELTSYIKNKRIFAISVPVQSGSNRIIKLMNRDYDCKLAISALIELKKYNHRLYLQGVFIVGFPTETESDFKKTLDFITEVKFNDVTLIPYSEFNICASAQISDKIAEDVIYDRINAAIKYLKKYGVKVIK